MKECGRQLGNFISDALRLYGVSKLPAASFRTLACLALVAVLSVAASAREVRARSGDTLWAIASRELGNGRRWSEIAALNNLVEPYVIAEGMTLRLPDNASSVRAASPRSAVPASAENAGTASSEIAAATNTDLASNESARDAVSSATSADAGQEKAQDAVPIADGEPDGALTPIPDWVASLRPSEGGAIELPSLTMPAAVVFALAHSPEVRVGVANIERLMGMEGTVFSAALPQVNATAGMRRDESFRSNFGGPFGLDALSRSAGLTVSQALYSFGRLSHALKAAHAEEAATRAALEDAKLQVRARVEGAFLGVLLARERLIVAREALDVATVLRDRARLREQAGVGTRFDVTRALAEAAAAQARLVAAQAEIATTREELAVAMGLPAGTRLDAVGEILPGTALSRPMPAAAAESLALAERPDLLVLEHRIKSSEEATAYERAKGWPSLDAVAGASYTYYDYISNSSRYSGPENSSGYVGVTMTVPVFDGFRVRESVRSQRAATDVLRAQYDRARLDAVRDVRRIYLGLGAALEALSARAAGVAAARDAVTMAQVSFNAGRATSLDVIQASLALADARRAEAETAYQFQIGLSQLVKATGTDEVLKQGNEE